MKTAEMSVALVDVMGDDLSVVNAARVSFDKESCLEAVCWSCGWRGTYPDSDICPNCGNDNAGWEEERELAERDAKLISYLAKHGHWSPFAHTSLQLRVKAPIFVARQLAKHQVGASWNEVSRRYVDSEPEFWFPKEWRARPDGSIKQGSGGRIEEITPMRGAKPCFISTLSREMCDEALHLYNSMIKGGVAPEQARMVLPQNMMTEWFWTGSLMFFARVCKQRLDPHAQQESQEIAQAISGIAEGFFPVSWAALVQP